MGKQVKDEGKRYYSDYASLVVYVPAPLRVDEATGREVPSGADILCRFERGHFFSGTIKNPSIRKHVEEYLEDQDFTLVMTEAERDEIASREIKEIEKVKRENEVLRAKISELEEGQKSTESSPLTDDIFSEEEEPAPSGNSGKSGKK